MAKKHYLLQCGDDGRYGNIFHIKGPKCGAICTAYLLGEYLNQYDQDAAGEDPADAAREKAIVDGCWSAVNVKEAFSDPFKIADYLRNNGYKQLTANPAIFLAAESNQEAILKLGTHPLYDVILGLRGLKRGGPGEEDLKKFLGEFVKKDLSAFRNCTYLLGVFAPLGEVSSTSDYHYILLNREDTGWKYINPHKNRWIDLTAGFDIQSGFTVGGENQGDKFWKWMDFGLIV